MTTSVLPPKNEWDGEIEPVQALAVWAKGILLLTLSRRASGRRHGTAVLDAGTAHAEPATK